MRKYLILSTLAASLMLCASQGWSQTNVEGVQKSAAELGPGYEDMNAPNLPYKLVPDFFKYPKDVNPGEVTGVAVNSKGNVFVFYRGNPASHLLEFDPKGNFIKEIGQNYYGFLFSHAVRIDVHDNIWAVDEGTNMITEFSPDGNRILMVLGHRPSVLDGPVSTVRTGPPKPNSDGNYTFCRPTDVTWDPQGDIFVSDGYCNSRVVKYSPDGHFMAKVGSNIRGKSDYELSGIVHAIAADKQGNIYVADRFNSRYMVYDSNLKYERTITPKMINSGGTANVNCISIEGPEQFMFGANSNNNDNPPNTWDRQGQIFKMKLDGTVVGKFSYPGKQPPGNQVIHGLDCRNPDVIYVGELESWSAKKYVLAK